MLATHADLDDVSAPPAVSDSRTPAFTDVLSDLEDELSSARGLLHGMVLGLMSLIIVAGAVWWAL